MSPRLRRKPLVVAAAVFVMGTALLWHAPSMRPVKDRDPADFWFHATGIDLGVKQPHRSFSGFYLPRDGWFIYYFQGFHERALYRVNAADATALFPEVVARLRNGPPADLHRDVEEGFRRWERAGARLDDAAGFLAQVREAEIDRIRPTNPELAESLRTEGDLDDRWARANRYSLNLAFEFAFLAGLIVFAAWPWLRGSGRVRWAAHVALLPALFCVPYWLGYCCLTFTSLGPSGGVLYPWLLIQLRGLPWTRLDSLIVRRLPPALEPLSQTPGPMMSLSFFGGPGPTVMALLGLAVGLAILGLPAAVRFVRAKTERGR
jgi:hypothetical protein